MKRCMIAVVASIVVLWIPVVNAEDQSATVEKMLERLAGRWTWAGQQTNIGAENSPYGQAGRFVGSGEGRLIMDGQFILDEYQEKSPEGNMLHGVSLVGYDPVKRCLVARDCMSDGSSSVAEFTIQGRVRKDNITITSKTGEILLARVAGEYSRDWKRLEATWEGSTDNGKTWQHWCSLVSEKTGDGDNDEQELIKLYDKLLTAAFKRDLQVIERALADDISIGTSEGKYITKEDILNLVSSDKFDLVSASNEDLKAKIFGNMAVVTGKFNWANEKGENGQEIFIDTFSKRDGRWQMVASHASKVTEQDNTEKNKVVLGRVFDEVFNAGKLDAIDEIYDEDFVSHMPGDSTHAGLARLKNMVAGIRKRMPDYHEDLKTMCVEGDFAACRWISTGTDGNSGKKFSFPCLSMYRFKDGKIIEQWILPDLEARKQSLGQ